MISSITRDDKEKKQTACKACKASVIARRNKVLSEVKNLTPLEAYKLGYNRGYQTGYWRRKHSRGNDENKTLFR